MNEEKNLYALLKEIYFQIDNGDRLLLESFNLSVPRFFLLQHIEENPGISLTRLSTLMLTDKSNITRLIKGVVSEGLVRKERHATDGRSWSLFLTDLGNELLSGAEAAHDAFIKKRFSPVKVRENGLLRELREVKMVLVEQLDKA